MSENDRPTWCQNQECFCLTGYASRLCVGRLPEKTRHDDLWNTHNFCLDQDIMLAINDAYAYYLVRCMQAVRQDVEAHGLYRPPGRHETWDLGRKKD